jgi:hypothetical protein
VRERERASEGAREQARASAGGREGGREGRQVGVGYRCSICARTRGKVEANGSKAAYVRRAGQERESEPARRRGGREGESGDWSHSAPRTKEDTRLITTLINK